MIKTLIVLVLAAIVVSLGLGLTHLVRGRHDAEGRIDRTSKRMATALSVRIALSVLLFVLLFVAWRSGLLRPHGL